MNGLFYLFIFSCRCRRFGRETPLHSNRFLMVCFPFLSFSISGHEKLAEENRNRTSASSVRLRRRGKERKQITTRKRQEWWKRGKRARFASGLYIVLCVCPPLPFHLVAWVSCVPGVGLVFACMSVCIFVMCFSASVFVFVFLCVCPWRRATAARWRATIQTESPAAPSTSLLSLSPHIFSLFR